MNATLQPTDIVKAVNKRYDRQMYDALIDEYYGHSDFHNLGYWDEDTKTQKAASENLVEKLLELLPEDKAGTVLDVACGKGATTQYLLKYYPPAAVTGINISDQQLDVCKSRAPGCTFLSMDATELSFADNSFDNAICVEAAFHFKTRQNFLHEVHRVLKPGGHLVLSDVLTPRPDSAKARDARLLPEENYISSLTAYRALWKNAGFSDIVIIDATNECRKAYTEQLLKFVSKKFRANKIDRKRYLRVRYAIAMAKRSRSRYVLAAGMATHSTAVAPNTLKHNLPETSINR